MKSTLNMIPFPQLLSDSPHISTQLNLHSFSVFLPLKSKQVTKSKQEEGAKEKDCESHIDSKDIINQMGSKYLLNIFPKHKGVVYHFIITLNDLAPWCFASSRASNSSLIRSIILFTFSGELWLDGYTAREAPRATPERLLLLLSCQCEPNEMTEEDHKMLQFAGRGSSFSLHELPTHFHKSP